MTRDERRWVWIFSILLIALTSIPYLVGFQAQGESWRFTGFVFGVGDGNSYIAKMLQGQTGAWLFTTPYSSEDSPGVLAFLPYLLLGKLAAGEEIHTQLVILFHLARMALIPLLVFAVYRFAAVFLPEATWRRWATALACAGGGLGWLLALAGRSQVLGGLPIDFYSPESFGFLAVFGLPHLILSRALLLFALTAYLNSASRARAGVVVGVILLGLVLVQPLAIASAYAALVAHLSALIALRASGRSSESIGPWARKAGVAVIISLPLVLYYAVGSVADPALQAWAAQNRLPSPHPVHYLLAYALVLVPAVIGSRALIRINAVLGWFLALWILALLILAYAPVTVQRRLTEGIWVAICVLAAAGLRAVPGDLSRRRLATGGVLGLSLGTSLFLLAGGLWQSLRPAMPVFRPAAEVAAFQWIADNAVREAVVLAAFDTGNALPAWAPVRSVTGHGPETANLAAIQPLVDAFFGGDLNGPQADRFLTDRGVSLVFRGPLEAVLGDWQEPPTERLEPVFEDSGYVIYAVRDGDG
jgi:hypothetical protein